MLWKIQAVFWKFETCGKVLQIFGCCVFFYTCIVAHNTRESSNRWRSDSIWWAINVANPGNSQRFLIFCNWKTLLNALSTCHGCICPFSLSPFLQLFLCLPHSLFPLSIYQLFLPHIFSLFLSVELVFHLSLNCQVCKMRFNPGAVRQETDTDQSPESWRAWWDKSRFLQRINWDA